MVRAEMGQGYMTDLPKTACTLTNVVKPFNLNSRL